MLCMIFKIIMIQYNVTYVHYVVTRKLLEICGQQLGNTAKLLNVIIKHGTFNKFWPNALVMVTG